MPESAASPDPATFYANLVTVHITVDEVSLECRRIMPPHVDIWRLTKGGTQPIPPASEEDIYKAPAIAKIVMTFSAARALRDNLNTLMPQIEKARREE